MLERNKALVRRVLEEAVNQGHLGIADELLAADYVYREPIAGDKRGREGFKQLVVAFRTAFTNMRLTVDQQVAEGDFVVTRWTARGTAPKNRHVVVQGILISRVQDVQIAEEFECYDAQGMMRQLGTVKAWGIAA